VVGTEIRRFLKALRSLDLQTVVVLTLSVLLLVATFKFGSRDFFLGQVAPQGTRLQSWAWWFVAQGITGFVIPVLILVLGFRRKAVAIGLGLGDWKLATTLFALYLPIVIVGTWVLSDGPLFQAEYPHYREAAESWSVFAIYHALFLFYWVGWEYLWRGFILFGTAHTFGLHTIFIQAVPFALMHLQKPTSELVLSLVGGIVLGALVWRCRAFWIAVPIHSAQMLALDFWCSLRIRTGASGFGLEALRIAFTGI